MTTVVCACVLLWGSAGLPRYLSVETLPAADAAREEGCAARGAQSAGKTAHTDKLARRGAGRLRSAVRTAAARLVVIVGDGRACRYVELDSRVFSPELPTRCDVIHSLSLRRTAQNRLSGARPLGRIALSISKTPHFHLPVASDSRAVGCSSPCICAISMAMLAASLLLLSGAQPATNCHAMQ